MKALELQTRATPDVSGVYGLSANATNVVADANDIDLSIGEIVTAASTSASAAQRSIVTKV